MLRATAACFVAAGMLVAWCGAQAQSEEQNVQHVIMLLRLDEYQQALTSVDKMLAATPHDCRLLSLRGLSLNGMGRRAEAVGAFKKTLQYCPNDLLALEGAAEIEYSRRQPDAVGLLKRVLAVRPEDVTAHAMLASLYRAKGKCRAALPHFEASSQMFAGHAKYQQAYAFCLADTGHYKEAAANYQQILGADSDPSVRFNLALVQWKMHDAKTALATLDPLLKTTHQEAVLTLGARLAEETEDIPTAVKLLREAIMLRPKNAANYLEFAQIAFTHHSAQVGIDMVNAGLTQLPNSAQLYLARGVLEVQLSKFAAGIAGFEKAHKLAPQLSLAVEAMGVVGSQQYKQTAAVNTYRKEARLHPKDSLLQYLYAEALSESGTSNDATQGAVAAAKKSVAINPSYAPARDLLALLYLRMNKPKQALVEAQAGATSACEKVWREARRINDFTRVRPHLAEVLRLVREAASCLAPALGLTPYDALMDGFQRGIGAADVAPIFAEYESFLHTALPRVEERQARQGAPVRPAGPFPVDIQEALCRRLAERLGLDFAHARLDRSAHPFSGGTSSDVRITTRYDEADFTQAVLAVVHETGHALYERGLPEAYARQPVGEAAGMAAHESQSLIVEMQACRSDPFLHWLGPELHAAFGGDPEPYRPANLARLWRHVQRGFIRVDADELTYPAHIILRFRLEQALIAGDLPVADLPTAWNEGFRELLCIAPPDDAHGCLQDIHWYDGAFGYFPSYTLGAMAASQLMAAARRSVPGLDAALGTSSMVTAPK